MLVSGDEPGSTVNLTGLIIDDGIGKKGNGNAGHIRFSEHFSTITTGSVITILLENNNSSAITKQIGFPNKFGNYVLSAGDDKIKTYSSCPRNKENPSSEQNSTNTGRELYDCPVDQQNEFWNHKPIKVEPTKGVITVRSTEGTIIHGLSWGTATVYDPKGFVTVKNTCGSRNIIRNAGSPFDPDSYLSLIHI